MRKLTITIALMLVVALAVPALGAGHHGSFSDVPGDHWAYDAINSLVAAGVVEGYPDGEYKGQQSMTRYEMAVMVSRALDNIIAEQEAMAEGLTEGQAADVTAIVESLMERNMPESLTDQQAEEVADIVEALTFELRAELQVLGADLDALYEDVEALEAKVDAMDVPEDNIEFGVTVETIFEVADYDVETAGELLTAMVLWSDGDALDLDLPSFTLLSNGGTDTISSAEEWFVVLGEEGLLDEDAEIIAEVFALIQAVADEEDDLTFSWEDADDLPSEKRFWQEIGFDVYGNVGDANFNLEVDTLVNVFTEEKSAFGYAEEDESNFEMDTAVLNVEYADTHFTIGDLLDYGVAPYFIDEEDMQGLSVEKDYLDIDWTFLVAGFGEDVEDDVYGVSASRNMDLGTVTGRLYQVRGATDQNEVLGLELADFAIADAVTLGGTVAYSNIDEFTAPNGVVFDSDFLFNVDAEFAASEDLTVTGMFEYVGENYFGYENDLEEGVDYQMFDLGAEFALDENNTLTGGFTLVQPGDQWEDVLGLDEDRYVFELGLENVYGDFTNTASVEFTQNDGFVEDRDVRVIELGTEYAWDEVTTLGAAWVNKDIDDADGVTEINYNYLKGHMNRELSENTVWNVEAKWIDGEVMEEFEATSSALTTSLTVSF